MVLAGLGGEAYQIAEKVKVLASVVVARRSTSPSLSYHRSATISATKGRLPLGETVATPTCHAMAYRQK